MAIVFLNGRYLQEKEAKLSIHDVGFLYGEAIYETLRTVEGQLMNIDGHLERLQQSALFLGIPLPPIEKIKGWLQRTVDRNGFWKKGKESRVRLTVSGGVHSFNDSSSKATMLIVVVPLVEVVPALRSRGISVVTYPIQRPLPHIKTNNLAATLAARRYMKTHKAEEVLLVDHQGEVTEGSISNLFIVKRGRLITPKTSMLGGTTRTRIVDLARGHRWKLKQRSISYKDLLRADEVFICNAPRGVVPVVKVDGKRVSDGKVGVITKKVWEVLKENWS
jgi:branched-chain amino acid aminotransferase